MNEDTGYTIVIPTYNGAERLIKILNAIESFSILPAEVVIVMDGSTDSTPQVVSNWKTKIPVQFIKQENKGRAASRNIGAQKAKEKFIIFYDDDMVPAENSAQRHLDLLRKHSMAISAGQQLENPNIKTEFGRYKAYLTRKWVNRFGDEVVKLKNEDLFLIAANMAIRKSDFEKLGGFDTLLRDAEDYDLAVRGVFEGIHTYFDPKNLATHTSFENFQEYIIRRLEYNKGQEVLMNLRVSHPLYALYLKYLPEKKMLHKFLYFFIPGFTVKCMDKNFFRWLPKKYRYLLYDRIISGLTIYYPRRILAAK